MIKFAVDFPAPIAIRYPRGEAYDGLKDFRAPIVYGKSEMICKGRGIALVALGSMVKTAKVVLEKLREQGYDATLVNARFAKPLDEEMLSDLAIGHNMLVTLEENVISGGFGEHVTEYLCAHRMDCHVLNIAIMDDYVEHGNVELLRQVLKIDADSILERILTEYHDLGLDEE